MSYQIINGEYVRMRREDELPQDMTEQSIENALVELGSYLFMRVSMTMTIVVTNMHMKSLTNNI